MALAIGIVLTLLVVGGVIFAYMRMNSRVKAFTFTRYDKSELDQIKNTQDLLPFKGIARNRIDLGNHRYVAYVKVEPFNYIIRSEEGKDSFAIRLRRAFNSIPFRTVMYIHTRKMVNNDMLARLSKTIDETVSAHPDQQAYADEYFKRLSTINIQNFETGALRKVSDYYLVIPWEPSSDIAGLSDPELDYRADEELQRRVTMVVEALKNCGVVARYLNTVEIINLLGSIYRREETFRADKLFDQTYLSVMVSGDAHSLQVPDNIKLKSILEGARFSVNLDIIDNGNVDAAVRQRGLKVADYLYKLESQLK